MGKPEVTDFRVHQLWDFMLFGCLATERRRTEEQPLNTEQLKLTCLLFRSTSLQGLLRYVQLHKACVRAERSLQVAFMSECSAAVG
jgi:hypothetical protein